MKTSGASWSLAGVVAGAAGLATSYLAATAMNLRESPVVAVAELVVRLTPGDVVELAISAFGGADKIVLVLAIVAILVLAFGAVGRLARRAWWLPAIGYGVLALVGVVATLTAQGSVVTDLAPIALGYVTWLVALTPLVERLRRIDALEDHESSTDSARQLRRTFLVLAGAISATAAVAALGGRIAGGSRRRVDEARRLLRLPGVNRPEVPAGVRTGAEDVAPWMTPNEDFYLIDTAIIKPAIEPKDWVLRIHGLVEREVELTYQDLVDREFTEAWITLNCVSNQVGGDLIGNAWWSGVRLADILAEAGPLDGADAVLQTSDDGWTCGTPLDALTDGRDAMLAVAMNGQPLPIDHGFPVRTIVPGLYGYVSATKWVVDMEVTNFSDISAFWTDRGWGEMGPVKMSSRIEVPSSGDEVAAGEVTVAGTAWAQHTGIAKVEVAVDGGAWTEAELAGSPSDDTWVQWRAVLDLDEGDHLVRVRGTDKDGLVQTGERRDVLPDGATGWHEVDFSVTA